jgi:hypothetical protein
MSIEHDLRRVLRRKNPSDGFAERVLARIGNEGPGHAEQDRATGGGAPSTRASARSGRAAASWLAAAAAVLLIAGGTRQYVRYQQVRSEKAKAEVIAALAIASEKLQLVRQIVRNHDQSPAVSR